MYLPTPRAPVALKAGKAKQASIQLQAAQKTPLRVAPQRKASLRFATLRFGHGGALSRSLWDVAYDTRRTPPSIAGTIS